MNFEPSYDNYRKILDDVLATGKLCDYWEAAEKDDFIVLRHDIEFSVARAYKLSLIESEKGVCSSYFVQLTNNAYNPFSAQNISMLSDMRARGHHIGLHYHIKDLDPVKVRDGIRDELRIMSEVYGFKVDRFAMHRPVKETKYNDIPIDGVINAYSPEFFTLVDNAEELTDDAIKYIADSRCRWNYGCPDAETLKKEHKIQLLVHADFWSESGYDAKDNFGALVDENRTEFIETIDSECKHFHQFKAAFLKSGCDMPASVKPVADYLLKGTIK